MKIAIACDHAGYSLAWDIFREYNDDETEIFWYGPDKPMLKHSVCGEVTTASCDYPDYAQVVGHAIADQKVDRGVLICGTGIGMCIAANKIPGVRAFVARTHRDIEYAVKHNHANVACFGARVQHPEDIRSLIEGFTWNFYTPDNDKRHLRRIDKIEKWNNED